MNKDEKLNLQFKVARDCLLADLLGRAQRLLVRLSIEKGQVFEESQKILHEVYEMQKERQKTIMLGQRLANGDSTEKYEKAISHYYREFACAAMEN